jgi:amino acid permease
MIYTAMAMAGRWWTKSYAAVGTTAKVASKIASSSSKAPATSLAMSLAPSFRPRFGTLGAKGALTPQVAIFIGMLSTAYMAHFNAPKFYTELKSNPNSKQSHVQRFAIVVATSFALSIGIFGAVASFGFLTFGAASSGVILNNYAAKDVWMNISRLAVTTSLLFSYPLAFLGFRDGVLDLFQVKQRPAWKINGLTVGLLSMITVLALIIPDVSFVLSFAGATLGNALIYILPAFMFRGAVQQQPKDSPNQKRLQQEVKLALANAGLGAVMGLLGAKMAIQSLLLAK